MIHSLRKCQNPSQQSDSERQVRGECQQRAKSQYLCCQLKHGVPFFRALILYDGVCELLCNSIDSRLDMYSAYVASAGLKKKRSRTESGETEVGDFVFKRTHP